MTMTVGKRKKDKVPSIRKVSHMTLTQLSVVITWKIVIYEIAMLSKWWRGLSAHASECSASLSIDAFIAAVCGVV